MICVPNMHKITQLLHQMTKLSRNIQKKGAFYAHIEEFSYFTQNLEILTSDWNYKFGELNNFSV